MDITLQRSGLAVQEITGQQVWPLKITATLAAGTAMPSAKIFVYHANMGDDAYQGDIFECVSSIQQYYELPVDAAVSEGADYVVPYYRLDFVQLNCLSPEEADELWNDIVNDVSDLIRNFYAKCNLTIAETVTLGETCTCTSTPNQVARVTAGGYLEFQTVDGTWVNVNLTAQGISVNQLSRVTAEGYLEFQNPDGSWVAVVLNVGRAPN